MSHLITFLISPRLKRESQVLWAHEDCLDLQDQRVSRAQEVTLERKAMRADQARKAFRDQREIG